MPSSGGTCRISWRTSSWTSIGQPTASRWRGSRIWQGAGIADLSVTAHAFGPVNHLYQSFMRDDSGKYLANIIMEGDQSEHEDEKGAIVIHDHEFNQALSIEDVYPTPFRELWMRNGRQTFDPLKTL